VTRRKRRGASICSEKRAFVSAGRHQLQSAGVRCSLEYMCCLVTTACGHFRRMQRILSALAAALKWACVAVWSSRCWCFHGMKLGVETDCQLYMPPSVTGLHSLRPICVHHFSPKPNTHPIHLLQPHPTYFSPPHPARTKVRERRESFAAALRAASATNGDTRGLLLATRSCLGSGTTPNA
jgi:hypothetical protein